MEQSSHFCPRSDFISTWGLYTAAHRHAPLPAARRRLGLFYEGCGFGSRIAAPVRGSSRSSQFEMLREWNYPGMDMCLMCLHCTHVAACRASAVDNLDIRTDVGPRVMLSSVCPRGQAIGLYQLSTCGLETIGSGPPARSRQGPLQSARLPGRQRLHGAPVRSSFRAAGLKSSLLVQGCLKDESHNASPSLLASSPCRGLASDRGGEECSGAGTRLIRGDCRWPVVRLRLR